MDIDQKLSPSTGSADSSRSESPATASTPPLLIDISESITIIATEKATEALGDEADKSQDASPIPRVMEARAYQREMFEASMKGNVIVAMDTGSGKTQVAVLRIQAELQDSSTEKIVWFLGKTLNVDAWSPEVWPRILRGTRIIVSTFDILRNALDHAFVRMDMLSLIVFDEVHNCVKNSSGRKIMINHYHEIKKAGMPVPSILGLTASPINSSKVDDIGRLKDTMDAKYVTPTIHRREFKKNVHKPRIVYVKYDASKAPARTTLMQQLQTELTNMDIAKDPNLLKLKAEGCSSEKLKDVVMKHDTFSQKQLQAFWNKCRGMLADLGSWAVDRYISQIIKAFLGRIDAPNTFFDTWSNDNRTYLAGHLRRININIVDNSPPAKQRLSHKASQLIDELLAAEQDTMGIIFVQQRATTYALGDLLRNYPVIRDRYRIGTFVGSKNASNKQDMYEYFDTTGSNYLEAFRSGGINLLVATGVAEEGLDIPACNLVVSFDEANTLKVHIQRRGRARKKNSKMIVLLSSTEEPRDWHSKERFMNSQVEDDQEEPESSAEQVDSLCYRVQSTQARLDLDNAGQILDQFCQFALRSQKNIRKDYVVPKPVYVFHEEESKHSGRIVHAKVTLPGSLPPNLRTFQSAYGWRSHKCAKGDAAFQACLALYKEGLVTDHLLPLNKQTKAERKLEKEEEENFDLTPEPLFNPWVKIARLWKTECDKSIYLYEFTDDECATPIPFDVRLPVRIPRPRQMTLYPVAGSKWYVKCTMVTQMTHHQSLRCWDHTSTLLAMNFAHRWKIEDREHVIKMAINRNITRDDMGAYPFRGFEEIAAKQRMLVRNLDKAPFHYVRTIPTKPPKNDVQHPFYKYDEAPDGEEYLVIEKWARRADLLHNLNNDPAEPSSTKPYGHVLPISFASVDRIDRRAVKCGTFIPHIIHELEVHLIASELSSTLLKPVGIEDLQLVLEAISFRGACEPVDYERLEFLGDSILKFCTSIQAYSEHPLWPEGLLSHFKDRIVSNERLKKVCLEKGLSKFILSRSFTARQWQPLYLDTYLNEQSAPTPKSRGLGAKNLADVVEALIGAAYQDGGMAKSLKCISVFLGDICSWHEEGVPRDILFARAPSDEPLPFTMEGLEDLINYQFKKKSLLIEAFTHSSYAAEMGARSYEQLEFLGDAVLDYIVVTQMFNYARPLSNARLHLIKTAMVNGHFLGFINMATWIERKEEAIKPDGTIEPTTTELPLWKFMRFNSSKIAEVMAETKEMFSAMREEILAAIRDSTHYPWTLLARFSPPKFYSDMFEALLGAVWVDSGSFEECANVLRNFGILTYMDRILKDDVHCQHPKEEFGKLIGNQKAEYYHTKSDGPNPRHSCKLIVRKVKPKDPSVGENEVVLSQDKDDEQLVGEVEETVSKETFEERLVGEIEDAFTQDEAETRAAEIAIKLLTEEIDGNASDRDDIPQSDDNSVHPQQEEQLVDVSTGDEVTTPQQDQPLINFSETVKRPNEGVLVNLSDDEDQANPQKKQTLAVLSDLERMVIHSEEKLVELSESIFQSMGAFKSW
ncbi:Dicer 2 [Fusarium beomiforme]|uniref:Dicer 2 n=1 Tax=Fusarium beomiforme TaxID=44412 RepID=A0A9P5AQE5_9HYPO|nr:Dicer 2 [Fusarium beomiforme]